MLKNTNMISIIRAILKAKSHDLKAEKKCCKLSYAAQMCRLIRACTKAPLLWLSGKMKIKLLYEPPYIQHLVSLPAKWNFS